MLALVILKGWTPSQEATVVDVMDGDSLVFMQDGERKKVRLYAIDAPEKDQAFGKESRAFTRSLVLNQPVTLKVRDEDRYHRLVSEVTLEDGRILNHELVRAGLAWWYERHAPDDRDLRRLQKQAQAEKKGLWADADPQPPWDYRNQHGTAHSR